jgi:hypothetical protein
MLARKQKKKKKRKKKHTIEVIISALIAFSLARIALRSSLKV